MNSKKENDAMKQNDNNTPFQILVVDDEPYALQATARTLRRAGYAVQEASTGLEGLEWLRANKPGLVLLDVVLPDIDGLELCRLIKTDPDLKDIYVMTLSSYKTSSTEQAAGLEQGADGYIARPIGNRELLARVEALLRLKRTEERLAQQSLELERSNTELAQFAHVVSHDLQEPLRMVTSYLNLLEHRYQAQLDSDAQEFIAYAIDGAERMRNLINDLLQYSRLNTRAKPFERIDSNTVLKQVLDNLKVVIEDNQAVITHDPLPTVMSDEVQLRQLFQNLISNALKFRADAAPQIHISAQAQAGEWLFSISDNGIGLDTKQAGRIFEIFQRLHNREEYSGTGMGLAICKKIVERHGGRIWVESQPGRGATFYFTLSTFNKKEQAAP